MTIERAIEILDPTHREHYDGLEEVNEACRMGMEALKRQQWIPVSERLPERDKRVLFWATYVGHCYPGYFDHISRSGMVRFTVGGTDEDHVASHWMALPEPPEEGGDGNADRL